MSHTKCNDTQRCIFDHCDGRVNGMPAHCELPPEERAHASGIRTGLAIALDIVVHGKLRDEIRAGWAQMEPTLRKQEALLLHAVETLGSKRAA